MITVIKNEESEIILSLDPTQLDTNAVEFSFVSPSQDEITLSKTLTSLGSGFFSVLLTTGETAQFVDDTYSYYLRQNGVLLKHGRVRLRSGEVVGDLSFDYVLDFLLG